MVDLTVDELKELTKIQDSVTRRYMYKPKDLNVWSSIKDELTTKITSLGFKCSVDLEYDKDKNWIPYVTIISRLDKAHQTAIETEGLDDERHVYEARHESSEDLKKQGIDTDLLLS